MKMRNTVKRFIGFLLATVFVFALVACSNETQERDSNLVGRWQNVSETGSWEAFEFSEDGTVTLTSRIAGVTAIAHNGSWSTDSGQLLLDFSEDSHDTGNYTYRVSANRLTIETVFAGHISEVVFERVQ